MCGSLSWARITRRRRALDVDGQHAVELGEPRDQLLRVPGALQLQPTATRAASSSPDSSRRVEMSATAKPAAVQRAIASRSTPRPVEVGDLHRPAALGAAAGA